MSLNQFDTKENMVAAWVRERAHEYHGNYEENLVLAKIEAKDVAIYTPHLYRGGFVIRGFGYSVERIGKYISKENAGNPELV